MAFRYLILAVAVVCSAQAQNTAPTSGAVDGVVVDINDRPIVNAEVYALSETAMTKPPVRATCDQQGRFSFIGLPAGSYYLDAAKEDEGYPYSLFSFYVMPGQSKPTIDVRAGETLRDVTIKLGTKAAYIELTVLDVGGQIVSCGLIFARPDFPGASGIYRTSFAGKGRVTVPAVPFSLSIDCEASPTWSYRDEAGSNLIHLQPGEVIDLVAQLPLPKGTTFK
jgi:Carboxypeptidase regulatory-like domain